MSNRKPTAVVADDETHLRDYLKTLLGRLWPDLSISADAANGEQALAVIEENKPDIAFLDIRMPGMNGLQVAGRLSNPCHLVFVTAYDEYAVSAFESAAIDYILKPVSESRLRKTIERLQTRLNEPPGDISAVASRIADAIKIVPDSYLQWIKAARHEVIELLPCNEIDFFNAGDKYVSVFRQGNEYIISKPLKELESLLDPGKFWRIHRSTIVRLGAVETVRQDEFSGRLLLKVKGYRDLLNVSRSYAYLFRQD